MDFKYIEKISKEYSKKEPFSKRPDIFTSICLATSQSIRWKKEGVTLIELGVYNGRGLHYITAVTDFLSSLIKIKFNIYGFDSFKGLSPTSRFEDHNELWKKGQYKSKYSYNKMVEEFKDKATIIKGNVKDTIGYFLNDRLDLDYPIGFISLDLDLYTSSKSGLKILEDLNPNKYTPTILMIVDDQDYLVTYNDWCGEGKAIKEFNNENQFRKIQNRKEIYQRLRCVHILDHPLRTGEEKHSRSLKINFKNFIDFNERSMI